MVSGLCDIPYACYSAKCTTQKWRRHVGVQLKYINMKVGNEWQHLEFTFATSNDFFSLPSLQTFIYTLLLSLWLFRPHKSEIQTVLFSKARYRAENRQASIFPICLLTDKDKNSKTVYFVIFFMTFTCPGICFHLFGVAKFTTTMESGYVVPFI